MELFIKELFEKYAFNYQSIKSSLSKNKKLKEKIKEYTSFLPISADFSQRLFHLTTELKAVPKCICGKNCSFLRFIEGYSKFCGRTCARRSNMLRNQKFSNTEETKAKKKKTIIEKYGVENIFQTQIVKDIIKEKRPFIEEKRKKTNLEKFGVEHVILNKEIMEKRDKTNIERFGVTTLLSIPEIRDSGIDKAHSEESNNKRKQTNLERYGVEVPTQNKEVYNKVKQTNLERYGIEYPFAPTKNSNFIKLFGEGGKFFSLVKPFFNKEEYFGGDRKINYKFQCLKCLSFFEDHTDDGHIPRCLNCYPYMQSPRFENLIFEWLKPLDLKVYRRDHAQIYPLEIDFYFPDLKIGIEFNELRSHSEISNRKNKQYHLDKTNKCLEKGIQLIHIFQDEWFFKPEIVKSIILSKLGLIKDNIYARNTSFHEVNKTEGKRFLQNNHLQGYNQQINNYFGLFHNNELVQLIGIGKSRYNKNYDYELIRSCTKLNTTVIGGFEKLMKNLPIKGKIISYVDRRYFNGNSYKEWDFVGTTLPNYYYCDKKYQQRMSRLKFQKHKLNYSNKDLTEWEIMQLVGYDRIWDCGNLVYSRTL